MPKEIISTPEAPQSPLYSQAVKVGHTIYVAGTTGVDVTTGEFAGATVKEQARQSLLNCQAILRAAGARLTDAVMVHTLLMRPEDADDLAEVFGEFFPDARPPRCVSKIGVDRPGLLVSIAMVAVTDLVIPLPSLRRSTCGSSSPRNRSARESADTAPNAALAAARAGVLSPPGFGGSGI